LETAEIPYRILTGESDTAKVLDDLLHTMASLQTPVALLIRKDTFADYKSVKKKAYAESLTREEALSVLLEQGRPDDLIVSTTGKTSRELFELRKKRGEAPMDFLTVGSMGHTSSIALGVALGKPDRRVICLDGDGSMIMHMGALPIIGSLAPANLIHVVINNGAHESVGGQATVARSIDFSLLAQACGYRHYLSAASAEEIIDAFSEEGLLEGPVLFEILVKTGSRADLGRPSSTPIENKVSFMKHAGSRS
jgi:phosphonopyruvate decarboxylase